MEDNVLVLVQDQFLREDILECVQAIHPKADIAIVETVAQARERLAQRSKWALAIIDIPEAQLRHDEIREAMRSHVALPVVLCEPLDDPQTRDWIFLDRPFNTEMLRAALLRASPLAPRAT